MKYQAPLQKGAWFQLSERRSTFPLATDAIKQRIYPIGMAMQATPVSKDVKRR